MLVKPSIPDALLTCRAEPVRPAETSKALAAWVLDLAEAGRDCRERLGQVKVLMQ